jgi:hypothetical protein
VHANPALAAVIPAALGTVGLLVILIYGTLNGIAAVTIAYHKRRVGTAFASQTGWARSDGTARAALSAFLAFSVAEQHARCVFQV